MNPTVVKNLKKIREIAGLTQDEVSNILNITRSAYSNYESGEREIPLNVLERISDLFGCELSVFYEDDINAESLILTSAFRLEGLTEADTEEIIRFKRIVKSYLKMLRIEGNFTPQQQIMGYPLLKLTKSTLLSLVIGDYEERARKLFEEGKISEGHYYELMNLIGIDDSQITS